MVAFIRSYEATITLEITPMIRSMKPIMVIAAFMTFLFCSCNIPSTTKDANYSGDRENTLRYDVNAPFGTLDPTVVGASGSTHVFPLLYSYLFVPGKDGNLEPDLAIQWDFDAEHLAWTIGLREDARFHDGQPVTAKDVAYSFNQWLKTVSPELNVVVDRVVPLSDTAVGLYLRKQEGSILQKIWFCEIVPHPDRGRVDYYRHPVGSGPFEFHDRNGEREIRLQAHEAYHGGRPALDGVVFYYQPDREKAWTRLLSRQTDIAQEISPKNYEMTQPIASRYYFDRYILPYYTILLYNTHDPLFRDPRVRRALAHAIDREYIVDRILKGYGKLANGPMGVDSSYHDPAVAPLSYDPDEALALLARAGWSCYANDHRLYKDGRPFAFSLQVFEESQVEKRVAKYIQLCLDEIGIQARLRYLPYEALKNSYFRNTAFQAVITEFHGVYHTFSYEHLLRLWCPLAELKAVAGCFDDSQVTHLLRTAADEADPIRRQALLFQAESLIVSLQPGTFLFQKAAMDVMSRRFRLPAPFRLDNAGLHRLHHASLAGK